MGHTGQIYAVRFFSLQGIGVCRRWWEGEGNYRTVKQCFSTFPTKYFLIAISETAMPVGADAGLREGLRWELPRGRQPWWQQGGRRATEERAGWGKSLSSPGHRRRLWKKLTQGCQSPSSGFPNLQCPDLRFPPISSPRTFPTISVKMMARELLMGTARVRSEWSEWKESLRCKKKKKSF